MEVQHVKGHQDKKTLYKDLPLLAKINVDADKLAGRFQDTYRVSRPTVLRFPVNTVQVNLHGINTITYKLKHTIYYEAVATELRDL